jgi:uncharacterized protein YqjF (DUF2071 family)
VNAAVNRPAEFPEATRRGFLEREKKPLLVGDWTRTLFLHFEVPADLLRDCVPFELDLREDRALVSLVAFSMEHLRPSFGGALGRWLFLPINNHDFFNVRTYVRHEGRPGIFFISEWLNNHLSVMFGPGTYGLPYRFARIQYDHRSSEGRFSGKVGDEFGYNAEMRAGSRFVTCENGSQDEFLLERYTAFTRRGRCCRYFDIAHEPWLQAPVSARITDDRLLRGKFAWFGSARLVGANYSPGVRNVWMGAPRRIRPMSLMGRQAPRERT